MRLEGLADAPARLSITIACCSTGASRWLTRRVMVSTELAGALGTISLTGRSGYSAGWPRARTDAASAARLASKARREAQ